MFYPIDQKILVLPIERSDEFFAEPAPSVTSPKLGKMI